MVASATFAPVLAAPNGKPTTVQTFTAEPANSARTNGTHDEFTHTLAKLYWRASRQILITSARVASAFRMVWSMSAAIAGSIFVSFSLAETRLAPAAMISLVLRAQVWAQRCVQPGQT
jgi:hypothetical protein